MSFPISQFLLILFPILLLQWPANAQKDILVNAPTFLDQHLDESIFLAKLLAQDGHRVHLLFMNSGNLPEETLKARVNAENAKLKDSKGSHSPKNIKHKEGKKGELSFDIVELPNFVKLMKKTKTEGGENPVELVGNKWRQRGTKQDGKILENEALNVYKEFLESKEAKEKVKELKARKFSHALFDTWDFGAQYIFFLLGIPNVEAFNKISLLSYQMEYAGTLGHAEHIPEVYAAKIGDAKSKANFKKEQEENAEIFKKVHREMNKWFNGKEAEFRVKFEIHKETKWPLIEQLYKNGVKNIFMDSQQALDFNLGKAKPENAHYFGGITLVERPEMKNEEKKNGREGAKVVLVSLDLCGQLVNGENLEGFRAFLEAFKRIGSEDSEMKFQIDCEDKNGEMKGIVGEGGNVFVKHEKKVQEAIFKKETRLLISTCSGGPVIDALGAGVPLICVPLMVDQYYISEALQLEDEDHQKVAIALDTNKIMGPHNGGDKMAADVIFEALNRILGEEAEIYLAGAHEMQKKMRESAKTAKDIFLAAFRKSNPSSSPHEHSEGHSGSKAGDPHVHKH